MHNPLIKLLDIIAPPLCAYCDKVLDSPSKALCEECMQLLIPVPSPTCFHCGISARPREDELPHNGDLCDTCMHFPPLYTQANAPYFYEGLLRELLPSIKYGKQEVLMHNIAPLITPFAKERILHWHDLHHISHSILVPMPMHWFDLFRRGFSAPMILAKAIQRTLPHTTSLAPMALQKVRRTPPQASLSHAARQLNLNGVLRADATHVAERHVILVDDVLTTGASANQAAQALKKAGASHIFVLTLARTPQA